jgi:hypothetical protein
MKVVSQVDSSAKIKRQDSNKSQPQPAKWDNKAKSYDFRANQKSVPRGTQ